MNQSTLIKNIHLGIKKTNDMYMAWTGGWWLTAYGVENFMVGNVARFIMEQEDRPAYASLEVSFRELYYDGGQLPKGRRSKSVFGNFSFYSYKKACGQKKTVRGSKNSRRLSNGTPAI